MRFKFHVRVFFKLFNKWSLGISFTLRSLYSSSHCIGDWMDSRTGLDVVVAGIILPMLGI
jgi:hypothetical protein